MRKLPWLVLSAAALLLAGCFNVETGYVVNEDGSGTYTVRLALPPELMTSLASMDDGEVPSLAEMEDDPDMQALSEALGDRGSLSFFSSEEEGFGFEMMVNVPPSEDFSASLAEIIADLPQDADADAPITNIFSGDTAPSIRRDGDTWTFQGEMQALTDEQMGELAGDEDAAAFAALFLDQSTVTVRLLLPGTVTEHNADEVLADGTLVWTQQGLDGARTLSATSTIGGDGIPRALIVVLVALVGASVVAVLAYVAMRRSGGAPA